MTVEVSGPINSGLAAGGAGVATANATGTDILTGLLVGFYVRYNDSPPATTDVTIDAVNGVMPSRTLLTLTNINTSGFYAVVKQAVDVAGASATGWFEKQPVDNDQIKVTVAQANDNDHVDVWPVLLRGSY